NRERLIRKCRKGWESFHANRFSGSTLSMLHRRQQVGYGFPICIQRLRSACGCMTDHFGFQPFARMLRIRLVPVPIELPSVDSLSNASAKVAAEFLIRYRFTTRLLLHPPRWTRVCGLFGCGVSLEQEPSSAAHLRDRRFGAKVPH